MSAPVRWPKPARSIWGAPADYGVSEASLAELDSLIEKVAEVKHAPRTAIARRHGATATLPELLPETRGRFVSFPHQGHTPVARQCIRA